MGMMDNLKNQAGDIMDDPDTRSKIEQMARDRNISVEEAKAHFMKQQGNQ